MTVTLLIALVGALATWIALKLGQRTTIGGPFEVLEPFILVLLWLLCLLMLAEVSTMIRQWQVAEFTQG